MRLTCALVLQAGDIVALPEGHRTVSALRSDRSTTGDPYVVLDFTDGPPRRYAAGAQLAVVGHTRLHSEPGPEPQPT